MGWWKPSDFGFFSRFLTFFFVVFLTFLGFPAFFTPFRSSFFCMGVVLGVHVGVNDDMEMAGANKRILDSMDNSNTPQHRRGLKSLSIRQTIVFLRWPFGVKDV